MLKGLTQNMTGEKLKSFFKKKQIEFLEMKNIISEHFKSLHGMDSTLVAAGK